MVAFLLAALFVDNRDNAVAVHRDQFALGVLDGRDVEELHEAVRLGVLLRLLRRTCGRAADMERTHGELRAGFADRLCGNNTHRFAAADQVGVARLRPGIESGKLIMFLDLVRQYRANFDAANCQVSPNRSPARVFGNSMLLTVDDDGYLQNRCWSPSVIGVQ